MISALWHGFYPGYFLAFFNWSILSILAKYFYKASLNYKNFNYDNILYKIFKFLMSITLMNYNGVMFFFLSFDLCWKFLINSYFFGLVILYSGIIFFMITGKLNEMINY